MILAIDTASSTASVALGDLNQIHASFQLSTGLTHSEQLLPMIDAAMNISRTDPASIQGIAVTIGPGSFTGLRIGIASAKGFALGWQVPVYGVNTLDVLAQSAMSQPGLICPCLNARRGEVYTALYQSDGHQLLHLSQPQAMLMKDLLAALDGREIVYFCGDGVDIYKELIQENGHLQAAVPARYVQAAYLIPLVADRKQTEYALSINQLEPLYLRESEAVIKWQEAHPGCDLYV